MNLKAIFSNYESIVAVPCRGSTQGRKGFW